MCSDNNIWTLIITVSAPIVASAITYFFAERRFKEQNRAQFLSYFLKFRYEAIKEVVAKITACRAVLNHYATAGAKNRDEAQEVTDKVNELFVAT
jgi:hypothetical protein